MPGRDTVSSAWEQSAAGVSCKGERARSNSLSGYGQAQLWSQVGYALLIASGYGRACT